jgi:hypothetical protein
MTAVICLSDGSSFGHAPIVGASSNQDERSPFSGIGDENDRARCENQALGKREVRRDRLGARCRSGRPGRRHPTVSFGNIPRLTVTNAIESHIHRGLAGRDRQFLEDIKPPVVAETAAPDDPIRADLTVDADLQPILRGGAFTGEGLPHVRRQSS